MTQTDAYLLGRSTAEVERLKRQSAELEDETSWLLDRLDIGPGARAIEIGCGPAAGAVPQLAGRVGPTGWALALDRSEQFVELARQVLRERGIQNAEVDAWPRLLDAYYAYSRAQGMALGIGRKTHRLFRGAGITDIHVNPIVHVYPPGHARRRIVWDFMTNVRDRMVAEGFIRDAEMTTMMAELEAHLGDPDTLVFSNLFFQVWGRKPG